MHHATTHVLCMDATVIASALHRLDLGTLVHQLPARTLATEGLGQSGDLSKVSHAVQSSSCALPLVLGGSRASSRAGAVASRAYVLACQRTDLLQPRHSAQTSYACA